MVVKRALPFSSRLMPVGAPIGRSGVFSSVGPSVFSAQSFSLAEGCRPSKTSLIGLSATRGFLSAICILLHSMIEDWELPRKLAFQLARAGGRLRQFPRFGVFPGNVYRVVEVQQKAFAAVKEPQPNEIVVHKGENRARNDVDHAKAAVTRSHCELGAQRTNNCSCVPGNQTVWGRRNVLEDS